MKGSYEILIQKLNTFIREYYKNLIARGFIYSLTGLVSVLIVFAVIEHFNFFSESIRSLLFWSYCAIGIIVIIKFIILPTIKMLRLTGSLSHEEAAKIIGRYFEEVADKLTNILELNDINAGNEALIHASIDQKIKEIEFTPFNNAIDWSLTLHYAKYMSIPILLILCFFVSGNKEIISDSTFRIINYNRPFTAPAPFYFELLNDSLVAIENSDFSIIVQISGDELPREVFVNYNNRFEKMNPLSKTTYSYTFENVRKNIDFYLSANNEYSTNYQLFILGRPQIEKMDMYILPPKHTNIKGRSYINTGSMSVPEGSQIVWKIKT